MSAWRVRVKDLQGKEYVLDVNGYNPGGTTLAQLKAKLQQKSGIHSAKQRLVFNREQMNNDGRTLQQYGISHESCLHIVILSGWIIRVEDRHNPGRVLEVLIEGHDPQNNTVQHLKQEIIKVQGESVMRLHEIRLMKHSAELSDRNTLTQCGITDNDTIQMRKKCFPPWNIFVKGLTGKTHTVVITQQNPEAYRKEERLAATILRQKESRQQNFMKSREEFIASSITSAFVGGGGGGVAHVEPMRGGPVYGKYRTPSPVEYHTFEPPIEMRPPMPPPPVTPRQRGLTTVTTLVISNLNDTVSRNDIYELCGAIGPLEHVAIVAPGVAEVTYRYKDDALEAYKKYNQRNLDGMPMMCRLQSGGRTRGPLPMAGTGYPGRIADQYPPEPMYGAPSGGFY